MSIYDRLIAFIGEQGVSQAKFLQEVGFSSQFLNKMRTTPDSLTSSSMFKILAKYPHIDIGWLVTGERVNKTGEEKPVCTECDSLVAVPCSDVEAAAGYGAFNSNTIVNDDAPLYLPDTMLSKSGRYLRIRMVGDSMEPTLRNGSMLIIRLIPAHEWRDLRGREVYVIVDREGHTFVKRVVRSFAGTNSFLCMSDNPDRHRYPDFSVQAADVVSLWHVEYMITSDLRNVQEDFFGELEHLRDEMAQIKRLLTSDRS